MATSIFLSRPTPHTGEQKDLLTGVERALKQRELIPRTIGFTDYGPKPMSHIRGVMSDCNGYLGIAFRRFRVDRGVDRPSDAGRPLGPRADASPMDTSRFDTASTKRGQERERVDQWFTSPYIHIESAVAFAMGLPVLFAIEEGVVLEGTIERGILTNDAPVFSTRDAKEISAFLRDPHWQQLLRQWEGNVREVVYAKGQPPRLYNP